MRVMTTKGLKMKYSYMFSSLLLFIGLMLPNLSYSNILGNDRVLACSASLGAGFSSCPSDLENAALSAIPIHTQLQQCDNSGFACIGGDLEYQSKKNYYTIFDVDNQETVKFEVIVYPDVFDERGNLIIRGRKSAKTIQPSTQEVKITKAFYELSIARKAVIDSYNLKISNGTITDATGGQSSSIPRSSLSCLTAWDYKEITNSCRGDLNRDIDDGVADNATFYAFVSSLKKLETVINVVIPEVDLSAVGELSSFNVKLLMDDGSILVIDVMVDEGIVEISLNEKASRTTRGDTFQQAAATGVNGFYSLEEANSVAKGTAMPIVCRPSDPQVLSTWRVVKTITTYLPDGTKRVTFVYAKQNTYIVNQECN